MSDGHEMILMYKENKNKTLRNEIILKYGHLVKYAVMSTRIIYQKYAESEDIVNEATLALMTAIDTFNPEREVKFETYASMKMRGAIIDFVRHQDIIPRSVRHFSKELEKAFSNLYASLGRTPDNNELANYMNIPKEKFNKGIAEVGSAVSLSFDDMLYDGEINIPKSDSEGAIYDVENNVYKQEIKKILAEEIENLNGQERIVISLYYYEKLKFMDIAKVLDVSESRISQIHTKAVLKLKQRLKNIYKENSYV